MGFEDVSRRRVLGLGAGALGATLGVTAAPAGADQDDCEQCWLDVRPGSCPNTVDANGDGVVDVAVGQPDLVPETARLVPRPESWGDCSQRRHDHEGPSCSELRRLLDADAGAGQSRWETYDEDGDGDLDKVFEFRVRDLDLRSDTRSLLLVGRDGHTDDLVWGVDAVTVAADGG